ncbi:LysR substrate-binding domain-containing protein [Bordetella pertussis]
MADVRRAARGLRTKVPGFGLQTLLDHCQIWCVPKPAFYFDQAIESIASHGGKIRRLSTSGNMPATVDILLAHGGIGLITDHLSQAHCQNGSLVAAFDGISPPGFDYVLACARSRQSHLLGTVMEIATAAVHAGRRPGAQTGSSSVTPDQRNRRGSVPV